MFKNMQYIPYIPMRTNTGQYSQFESQIHTNTDKYWQIPTNTYNTYHYLSIQTSTPVHTIHPIQINTYKYISLHTLCTIHTNPFQYRSVLSNTYTYRHILTNTYQYVQYISLLTNSYKCRPVHTIHNIDGYVSIQFNTYQYVHYIPFFHACQY